MSGKRKGHENLNPVRTKEEARERGKNGGKASGAARRKKRTIREALETLLAMQNENDPDMTNMQAVAVALLRKAEKGDVYAFTALRDSIGEKPTDKVKIDGEMNVSALEEGRERAKKRI